MFMTFAEVARIANLEFRLAALESRLATSMPATPPAPVDGWQTEPPTVDCPCWIEPGDNDNWPVTWNASEGYGVDKNGIKWWTNEIESYSPHPMSRVQASLNPIGKSAYNAPTTFADAIMTPTKPSQYEHHGSDNDNQVFFYERDFYPLSNFSAFRLRWNGIDFDTLEHAYHWEKFHGHYDIQREIINARSAHDAFKIAERNKDKCRADWKTARVDLMPRMMFAKASQHEYVYRKVVQTNGRQIIEDSWRDSFWGWGPNQDGENMAGKSWEKAREMLEASPPTFADAVKVEPAPIATVEPVVDEIPLPKGCVAIEGFPLLYVDKDGHVRARKGKRTLFPWRQNEIKDMRTVGNSEPTIRQAAEYVIAHIARSAGLTVTVTPAK